MRKGKFLLFQSPDLWYFVMETIADKDTIFDLNIHKLCRTVFLQLQSHGFSFSCLFVIDFPCNNIVARKCGLQFTNRLKLVEACLLAQYVYNVGKYSVHAWQEGECIVMVLWSFYSCWVRQRGSREVRDGGQLPCCQQLEINSLCSLCYFHTCLAVLVILTTIFSCFVTCHVVWYFSVEGFFLPISTIKNLLSRHGLRNAPLHLHFPYLTALF